MVLEVREVNLADRIKDLFGRMASSAGPTLRRFWAPTLFSIAFTTAAIISSRSRGPAFMSAESLNRLSLALLAGCLASLCAVQLVERIAWGKQGAGNELLGNFSALAFGAGIVGVTYVMVPELSLLPLSRHLAICLFFALSFFVIPCFREDERLPMYVVRIFSQGVLAALFSAVTFVGLAGITFTVSSLFSLKISANTYLHIWMVMAGVLAPFLLMAGIPAGGSEVTEGDYPKTLRNLIIYVVTPLLAVYTVILYLYFAKILLTREWPVGLVAHLVLWYSLASTAILYFAWPLAKENRWAGLFAHNFPRAIIPLLGMMFLAIGIRVNHYGITENRYYVIVIGLWVFVTSVYLSFAKNRNTVLLPASLAVVVLLSVFGPWSSFSVSMASQNGRLEGLLEKYGMVQDGAIAHPVLDVPEPDRVEMREILSYFDRFHELSDVELLPQGFALDRFEAIFGFPWPGPSPTLPGQTFYYSRGQAGSMEIRGYEHLFDYARTGYDGGTPVTLKSGNVETEYDPGNGVVSVILDEEKVWEKSLEQHLIDLVKARISGADREVEFGKEDMILEVENGKVRVRIVFTEVSGFYNATAEELVSKYVGFYMMVGVK